jgi:hypothetical protein
MPLQWTLREGIDGVESWWEASVGYYGFGMWLVARPSSWQLDVQGAGWPLDRGTATSLDDAKASAVARATQVVELMREQLA